MVRSELTFDGSRVASKAIGPGSLVASRFRLEDLLEEHSGARFWRATDTTLARSVAVHVIARDDPRAAAVLTAARTSATVSDQRILRVLDAVEEDEFVHVVHEWGAGVSLDRLLAGETLEPRRAAWLVREVAEAIAVAHRHGIAHGHLLPENVLLTDVGSVKLIGFVVDAVLHGRPQPEGATEPPLSEHESDVLNLGALLYACLTGRWAGVPDSALPRAPYDHDRVCRPRQVRAGVPRQLDTLCDQILNPSARGGRRFESASEVCSALGDYLGDTTNHPVDLTEATAFLNPADLAAPRTQGTLGSFDGLPSGETPRPSPGAPRPDASLDTQPALPRPDAGRSSALEETQPAMRPLAAPGTASGHGGSGGATSAPVDEPGGRRGPSSLRIAAIVGVVALLVLALLLGRYLGGSDSGTPRSGAPSSVASDSQAPAQVIKPAAVDDFDPDGGPDPSENPELVPLAVDGKPGTAWETKTYYDGPVLAPYRSGVGLLLDLGKEADVGEVTVSLVGGPYDLALLAAPSGAAKPTSTAGLTKVEARSGVSGEVTLRGEKTIRTRYVVVWLTALPRATDGYRGAISEVVVRS